MIGRRRDGRMFTSTYAAKWQEARQRAGLTRFERHFTRTIIVRGRRRRAYLVPGQPEFEQRRALLEEARRIYGTRR
jgi:hypothetical protein